MIAIVATDLNGGIGKDNDLPWRCKADLEMFRFLTEDNAVIMGRKTYESIGKPLPGRLNIVLTKGEPIPGVVTARSYEEALDAVDGNMTTFVIGGGQVYKDLAPLADGIIQTVIKGEYECDTFFDLPKGFNLVSAQTYKTYETDPEYEVRIYKKSCQE